MLFYHLPKDATISFEQVLFKTIDFHWTSMILKHSCRFLRMLLFLFSSFYVRNSSLVRLKSPDKTKIMCIRNSTVSNLDYADLKNILFTSKGSPHIANGPKLTYQKNKDFDAYSKMG